MSSQNIHLYLTSEHDCGYLPGRKATNLVPDPNAPMNRELYSQLIRLGYRRSGDYIYRPHCNGCEECKPCRLHLRHFKPSRGQLRCLKMNRDLKTKVVEAQYTDEHFELYRNYINTRHSDGQMADPAPGDFTNFLLSQWCETRFIEIRDRKRLIAVAVTDHTRNDISAVYSYFDPQQARRSLGTYCILQQIQQGNNQQLDYLYMGYWIRQSRKMRYKSRFQPLEILVDNHWKKMVSVPDLSLTSSQALSTASK